MSSRTMKLSSTTTARRLACGAIALGAALTQATAHANDTTRYLTAGVLVSIPLGGSMDNVGVGVETSYNASFDDTYWNVGAFLQAQYLLSGGWRIDAGGQGNFAPVGAELGLAVVAPHGDDPALALHVAPYLTVGYAGASFRWTRRFSGEPERANEFALSLTAKAWWRETSGGEFRMWDARCGIYGGCVAIPGRPLTLEGVAFSAKPIGGAVDGAKLDPAHATAAAYWTRAMLDEHASIASFARTSLALMALGAPLELVARTHAAALDEVLHARRCAALATRFGATPVAPGALPEAVAPHEAATLVTLAVATLREGCVNEGAAALLAARCAAEADDPEVREALALIARDEARHAALAWDTLDWCCAAGGDAVKRAVADALEGVAGAGRAPSERRPNGLGVPDAYDTARCHTRALRIARRRVGRNRPQHAA
jgi:hypothetical protein